MKEIIKFQTNECEPFEDAIYMYESPPSSTHYSACNQYSFHIYECPKCLVLTPQEHHTLVKQNQCFYCLGTHLTNVWITKFTCRKCQKQYHMLLHVTIFKPATPVTPVPLVHTEILLQTKKLIKIKLMKQSHSPHLPAHLLYIPEVLLFGTPELR